MRIRSAALPAVIIALTAALSAQAPSGYLTPPKAIADITPSAKTTHFHITPSFRSLRRGHSSEVSAIRPD